MCHRLLLVVLYHHLPIHASTPLHNNFCTDHQFQQLWNNRDEHGAPLSTLKEIQTFQNFGWSTLKKKGTPSNEWGVCPCHNAAFTSDSEQWDGVPARGLDKMRHECYFNLPQCAQHFATGNCPGASFISPSPSSPAIKILVATTTPYTIHQFSNEQAGRCSARCDFITPTPNQPINIESFDSIIWPLDWSFGTSNTMRIPNNVPKHVRAKQTWIGFTEEDMFKTGSGRPDLWSNRTFLATFDLLSSYDYFSSDLPFNLYKFHLYQSCTINMYFAAPPNFTMTLFERLRQFEQQQEEEEERERHPNPFPLIEPPSLISYVSRNCRKQRDNWVLKLSAIMPVAAIGKCLHNHPWPFPKSTYPYWLEKILAIRKYPFVLAIEGSGKIHIVFLI